MYNFDNDVMLSRLENPYLQNVQYIEALHFFKSVLDVMMTALNMQYKSSKGHFSLVSEYH